MNDKDLKTILQQTFKEIYGDLGSLAEMAKKRNAVNGETN
ncbi:activation of degradative enzymes (aprE, nprE, sacB) [Bacillus amyloliquefaciens]|nr:activation of degradative enzymes (aprE, nprE, sacB) [Bacillus amyloliquefaciens]